MEKIRVMLVDDQALIIEGIKTLLSIDENILVVAEAFTSESALSLLQTIQVDVIMMDIRMPGRGGVEGTRKIIESYPDMIILILTTFDDDQYIIDALRYGARGYLLKDISALKLIDSVHEAFSGNLLLTGRVAKKLANSAYSLEETKIAKKQLFSALEFTEREMEIIQLMLQGLTSKEISEKLYLTQGTVKNYFSNIYGKIGTNDRTKALLLLKDYVKV